MIDIMDRRLANVVKKCQELPGQSLFEYIDHDGNTHEISSSDVNAYLHEISGQDFTAKDFRTWAGTVLAALAFAECEPCDLKKEMKSNIKAVINKVSEHLGNTPAICRKCYIHPELINSYLKGSIDDQFNQLAKSLSSTSYK